MKRIAFQYLLVGGILLNIFLLPSCKEDNNMSAQGATAGEDNVIGHIGVRLAERGEGENPDGNANTSDGGSVADTKVYPFEMPFSPEFDSRSVIFVSQQTSQTAPFRTIDAIYPYQYKPDYESTGNKEDDWYDEVYNFTPLSENPLEWFKIGNTGSYLNGFSLYALYFPLQQEMTWKEENGNITYSVEKDQSTLDNLIKSDIMGAYHSSPTLFSKLNFRLFHLMSYVGVRVYVPVYNETKKTGFYDGALQAAFMENANNEFGIEWNVTIHSDDAGPKIKSNASQEKIKMYLHELPAGVKERPVVPINYKDFVYEGFFDQGLDDDIDYVRVYDFSVLLPMQDYSESFSTEDSESNYLDIMSFVLRSNSGAETYYYFNQSTMKDQDNNHVQLNQGYFQYLELYVPRIGNKVVYAGAVLESWGEHSASFPLHDDLQDDK